MATWRARANHPSSTRVSLIAPDWLTVLSAALIVLAFPPWELTPLIWICLVPWFLAIHRAPTVARAALQGLWLSILMSLGGFYWVGSVLKEFGGLPWSLAAVGMLGYAVIGQPQFTLFGPILRMARSGDGSYWLSRRRLLAVAFGLALAYAGVDWVLPKLFVDTLGHSLYRSVNLRQCADLGGAALLTFLVYFVNDALASCLFRILRRREPSLLPALRASAPQLAISLFLLLAGWKYGSVRDEQIRQAMAHSKKSLQAAVIQANIGDFDKLAAERGIRGAGEKVIETFFRLSDQALAMNPKPDVLVWPETSYPSTFRTPQTADELERDQQVDAYVRDRDTPLVFGGYDHAEGKDFNALFFLSPDRDPAYPSQGTLEVYHKNILLLFGEYIPGSDEIKALRDAFPQVGNFGRGKGPEVLKIRTRNPAVGEVAAGPIICYEALFPNYVIAAARKGSQLILNITNDSWFGETAEPWLHLSLTVFRSIETRLPQLRATNTGISALVLPDGTIAQHTDFGEQVMNARVPIVEPVWTLMKEWGDWFGPFALVVGFLLIAGTWLAGKRRTENG